MVSLNFCLLLSLLIPRVVSTCYYPNGDTASGDVSCNSDQSESACCGPGYACLSNTICLRTSLAIDGQNGVTYVRGSCTDQSWNSPSCPKFCVNANSPYDDNVAGGQSMGKCENEAADIYYCGDKDLSAVNCADNDNVISFSGSPSEITIIGEVSNTGAVAAKTTSSSSTLTSTSATAISITSSTLSAQSGSTTSHTNTPQSSSSNKGVAVGAGVGVSVGVIVLGLIAAGFYYYGQWQGRKSVEYLSVPGPGIVSDGKDPKGPVTYYSPVAQIPLSELPQSPGTIPPSELSHPLETPRGELPDDQSWATMNTPWSNPHVY